MLTENMWVSQHLVNGSLGTVEDVIWAKGTVPLKDPPLAILVHFPDYKGPGLVETPTKLVPIFRSRREWVRGMVICSRTQFPLVLAYAITIYKSQSTSLDQAILNISEKRDFTMGLTYVAISRVRTLQGLLFEEPFDFERLRPTRSATWEMREQDKNRRRGQELLTAEPSYLASISSSLPYSMELPIRTSSPAGPAISSDPFGSEFKIEDLPSEFNDA
jgi:ATP-dependent exoDNAse (exonuclease V) alpha subunit